MRGQSDEGFAKRIDEISHQMTAMVAQNVETEQNKPISHDCHNCVHRRPIPGDAHIQCAKPDPLMIGDPHGVKNGWFMYPLNFDPVWAKKNCSNYLPKPTSI